MGKSSGFGSYWSIIAVTLLFAAISSGCTTLKTGAHHDESASFQHYRTYAWIAENPIVLGEDDQHPISPLAQKKIVKAVENELVNKGFVQIANPEEADFVVAYTVGSREKIVAESYPTAYQGRWGWHLYGRYYYQTEVVHRSYSEGTLGIDIFDGETKEPVWHGWASRTLTSADRNDPSPAIEKAVAAIIKRFPPSE